MAVLPRRQAVGALLGCGAGWLGLPALAAAPPDAGGWPAWRAFKAQFVSEGGRVVDASTPRRQTVSEAQAYALFFALVANDRAGFERLLRWTEDNLCGGDLAAHLPAWLWGRLDDGSWGVVDRNPASDADLWLAYALGEAGRLWGERRYGALSSLVSTRVLREETAELPGLGLALLPGPKGFAIAPGRWRLNASYVPPQLMRWLALHADAPAPWQRLAESSLRLIGGAAPRGYAADWVVYDARKGFEPDLAGPEKALGGYNAIRVYLWAGMLHADAPERASLLRTLRPMAQWVRENGQPPETIDSVTGQAAGSAPSGFSAALMPLLQALDPVALQLQRARLEVRPLRPDAYYEQALALFALGWMEGYFRFGADGRLQPRWKSA